jgi:hypothetical protein
MATEAEARAPRVSTADGMSAAAAVTVLVGFFGVVTGFSGIVKSTYIVNSILVGNPITWGVVMLVVGVLQMLVAFPMGQPRRWAVAGAALLAVAGGVLNVNVLGGAPGWAILLVAADVVILFLLGVFARGLTFAVAASDDSGPPS